MFLPHVPDQAVLPDERPATLLARAGRLLSMRQQMYLERRFDRERLITDGAAVRLLALMQYGVSGQVLLPHKGLIAGLALKKGLLALVNVLDVRF